MNTRRTMHWLTGKGTRTAGTASRASSIPMPMRRRCWPMPTWCCRRPPRTLRRDQPTDRRFPDADAASDAIRHRYSTGDPMRRSTARRARRPVGADRNSAFCLTRPARPGERMVRRRYRDYADYIVRHERAPASACWPAGAAGRTQQNKARRTDQLQPSHRQRRLLARADPGILALLQDGQPRLPVGAAFRLRAGTCAHHAAAVFGDAAEVPPGRAEPRRAQPPPNIASAVATYFDPLPIWVRGRFEAGDDARRLYRCCVTRRPMFVPRLGGSQ